MKDNLNSQSTEHKEKQDETLLSVADIQSQHLGHRQNQQDKVGYNVGDRGAKEEGVQVDAPDARLKLGNWVPDCLDRYALECRHNKLRSFLVSVLSLANTYSGLSVVCSYTGNEPDDDVGSNVPDRFVDKGRSREDSPIESQDGKFQGCLVDIVEQFRCVGSLGVVDGDGRIEWLVTAEYSIAWKA